MTTAFIDAWRHAAAGKNVAQLDELLADGVRLISPISFKPVGERRAVLGILAAVIQVLPDLVYTRGEATATGAILLFEGTVTPPGGAPSLRVEGIDVMTLGADGRATEIKVFVRPLKAATAFAAAMAGLLV